MHRQAPQITCWYYAKFGDDVLKCKLLCSGADLVAVVATNGLFFITDNNSGHHFFCLVANKL